jgi:flagellar motility protein MotE (MotC chaperone)
MISFRKPRVGTTVPLIVIASFFAVSGILRIGEAAGAAAALELGSTEVSDIASTPVDIEAALVAIRERQAFLDEREAAIEDRMQALSLAETVVGEQLGRLREAEARLRDLLALADESAENDLAQLTSVYENMKPKDASLVFQRMAPDFAAGFMARMRPEAAAAIMSGLPPDLAYTISVLLAGRNVDAAAAAGGL